jgi:hypothetical protein
MAQTLTPLTPRARFWRMALLGLAGALGLAAYGYGQGWAIPHWRCWFQAWLTIPGPGCGLTRSWIALAQGHGLKAMQYHLFGPVLALAVVIAVAQAAVELAWGYALASHPGAWRFDVLGRLQRHHRVVVWAGAIAMLLYYGLRLYGRYGSSALPFDLEASALWQWIRVGAQQL